MSSTITLDELAELLDSGTPIQFVETLRAEHFEQGHIPGAVHIHFEAVEELAEATLPDKNALIFTYCSNTSCQNSRVAAAKLEKLGYANVRRYEAGKDDWVAAGRPLETGVAV